MEERPARDVADRHSEPGYRAVPSGVSGIGVYLRFGRL